MADIIDAKSLDIKKIAERVRQGQVFIYPTDTVYGIGCDATNEASVKRVYAIKGRDFKKPLSVAFSQMEHLIRFVSINETGRETMAGKLPGAYTFIVKNKSISPGVTASLGTVGVRIPDYQPLLSLIKKAGVPVVTTSANLSGEVPSNDIANLSPEILKKADFVIDAGECGSGKPSTIIDLSTGKKIR